MTDQTSTARPDHDPARGHQAHRPRDIPRAGWGDILRRTRAEAGNDNLSIVSAGVAFYLLLSLVPALAAVISIYGLVADPATVETQINALGELLPSQAQELIAGQLERIASGSQAGLGLGAVLGLLLTLWSTAKGMKALIVALNISYDEHESRGFIKLNLVALGLTVLCVLIGLLALSAIIVLPALLGNLGLGEMVRGWINWLRWPVLALALMVGLSVVYRYAPDRSRPRWRWVSWGAVLATVLWLLASAGFSLYVRYFGSYNETYGSLGAVVVLMMWFFISAYIVLLGAELNAESEHQTARDSTAGGDQPMGERGAHVADTVAERSR